MPDEPADVPQQPLDNATRTAKVRKLHYIVHVEADTNQIIKVEEMDEEAKTSRELPLPLFLSFDDDESDAEEEFEGELEFDWPSPPHFFQPPAYGYPPHGYFGYPFPMHSPFMPAPCVTQPVFAPDALSSPRFVSSRADAEAGGSKERLYFRCPKVRAEFRGSRETLARRCPKVRAEFRESSETFARRHPKVRIGIRGPKVNFGER